MIKATGYYSERSRLPFQSEIILCQRCPIWLNNRLTSQRVDIIFGVCSLWHLAAVSVVKCTVIVRPLTHFSIFTDRVLRAVISCIWILSLLVGGAINAAVTESRFDWIKMTSRVEFRNSSFRTAFSVPTFVIPTLIITVAYIKVFLVIRRQVRSMPSDVLGSFGSRTIFGSSVRSAKNLFVMCAAYYLAYLPVILREVLRAGGLVEPDAVDFAITWIYVSSAALNGFLYIALHSSVRRELRRYLRRELRRHLWPRCRRRSVGPVALTQPVAADAGSQRYLASVDTGARATGAPVAAMTSSLTQRLPTIAI